MQTVIQIKKKLEDSRISALKKDGINYIEHIFDLYKLKFKAIPKVNLRTIARCFANQISQSYCIFYYDLKSNESFVVNQNDKVLGAAKGKLIDWDFEKRFTTNWVIQKSFLPGITNSLASTAYQIILEKLKDEKEKNNFTVETATLFLTNTKAFNLDSFYNPLIEEVKFEPASEKKIAFKADKNVIDIEKQCILQSAEIPLDAIEEENKTEALGLNIEQIKSIKKYYQSKNKNSLPKIELESIAQSWSEHCKHNIFSYPIDDLDEGIFKTYIKGATDKIIKENPDHICASVFIDNAGAICLNQDYLICTKVETHNSPSALEPFGGALTGILGVNRDIIGFGMGAKPIANYYTFCFDDFETENKELYKDKECKSPKLGSVQIMNGVIKGVNVGGNCSGIPTPQGALYFDGAFCAKPLVFVGCTGIIPKVVAGKSSCIKKPQDQDLIVIVGGATGKDGIHGATFSSSAIKSSDVKGTEVQIGDPFTQKKLSDAITKEARDLGLYNAITDNGAGGFSSSVGEMGREGFEVDLLNAPLKTKSIFDWQVWISESQERMTLAIPDKNIKQFEKIMQKHDVQFYVIGRFNRSGKCIVKLGEKELMNMDAEFLHNGNPKIHLKTKKPEILEVVSKPEFESLKQALSDKNICSRQFIASQYDHEVQGSSVLKPLQGKGRVFADTSAIKPLMGYEECVVQSQDLAIICDDPYKQTAIAIEQAIRNIVAAGANPKKIALLDNFCWSDSNNPERLWQLKHSARACYDYSIKYKTPFISGKDSMFNDFKGWDENGKSVHLRNLPSVLITAVGVAEGPQSLISLDAKFAGDLIYLIQSQKDIEEAEKLYTAYHAAVIDQLIASAIAVNMGGVLVAIAKKAIAGQLGFDICIDTDQYFKNTSEIVVTIDPKNQNRFEKVFKGLKCKKIGSMKSDDQFLVNKESAGNLIEMSMRYNSKEPW